VPISLQVKNIMTKDIVSIQEDVTIIEAINKMVENDIGSIAIKRKDEYVGVVTERDILKKCEKENIYAPNLTVGKFMSSPLITVDADDPIGRATQIMEAKNVRRLFVRKNDAIVGILTQKDILRETLNVFMALQSI
jgi:CBS domain-containing protein